MVYEFQELLALHPGFSSLARIVPIFERQGRPASRAAIQLQLQREALPGNPESALCGGVLQQPLLFLEPQRTLVEFGVQLLTPAIVTLLRSSAYSNADQDLNTADRGEWRAGADQEVLS